MLRTRATGLLSGRQMTASPISSAPAATTNCSDEPLQLRLGGGFSLRRQRLLQFQGGPARNRAVFINLGGECAKEGVRACEPDFADLALCFALPVAVSLEG